MGMKLSHISNCIVEHARGGVSKKSIKNSVLAGTVCFLGLGLASIVEAAPGQNRILSRLEANEVLTTKTGSAFVVQGLANKEFEKVAVALSDLTKLPSVFQQIAFARPYKNKDGRQFLYLKTRGLMDGMGLLMEVRSAEATAFVNARELMVSGEIYKKRDIGKDADLASDESQLQLKREMDEASKAGEGMRDIGILRGITLEGPLNPVMQLPNVRFTINLGVAPYTYIPPATSGASSQRKTYMVVKVAVGNQVASEFIGDYRGFGEQRLTVASMLGQKVLESLRERLEKL